MGKFYFFEPEEFLCKCGCGRGVSDNLIHEIDAVRAKVERPLIINSGMRCVDHNLNIGGSPNSSHLEGIAADINMLSSKKRYRLLKELFTDDSPFRRIGIGKDFIHVDMDRKKPDQLCWTY